MKSALISFLVFGSLFTGSVFATSPSTPTFECKGSGYTADLFKNGVDDSYATLASDGWEHQIACILPGKYETRIPPIISTQSAVAYCPAVNEGGFEVFFKRFAGDRSVIVTVKKKDAGKSKSVNLSCGMLQ